MLSKNNRFISWLLCGLLCFSNSFSVINAEEEIIPENEPEVQGITVEENQETEEEQENTENNEELPEETPDISEELEPEATLDTEYNETADETLQTEQINDFTKSEGINDSEIISEENGIEISEISSTSIDDFTYTYKDDAVIITKYKGNDSIVEIPSIIDSFPVTTIGEYAFSSCKNIFSVILPDTITTLEEGVFNLCENLDDIKLPKNLISIGDYAFCGDNLHSITITENVESIGWRVFEDCPLSSINVVASNPVYDSRNNCNAIIETATNTLLYGCKNSTIPYSITTIGEFAFAYCYDLTGITIPDSVVSIKDNAFACCEKLASVNIPNGVKYIGYGAFSSCKSLTSIFIPASVTEIDEFDAFSYCPNVNSIVVDPNNPVYDSRDNCNAIIKTMVNRLIYGCKNTVIPEEIRIIGSAFLGCTGLTSIAIPKTVINIAYTFNDCENLTSITVDPENPIYDSRNNCNAIIITSSNTLLVGCKNTIIPDGIKTLYNSSFSKRKGLTSIVIPESVTKIEACSFLECEDLRDVYYTGNPYDWSLINIYDYGNESLLNATIHYNYNGEQQENVPIIVIPGVMGTELYDFLDWDLWHLHEIEEWEKVWVNDDLIIGGMPLSAPFEVLNEHMNDASLGVATQPVRDDIVPYYESVTSSLLGKVVTAALIRESHDRNEREQKSEYGTLDNYKELIELVCEEYPDREVYFYAYDWRKSNAVSAQHLYELMETEGIKKADILAHSMGGLVLSHFVNDHEDKINHSITFGTPYEGADKLLAAILTQNVTGNVVMDIPLLLSGLSTGAKKQFTGVAELSPTSELIGYEGSGYEDNLYAYESEVFDKSQSMFFRNDQFDPTFQLEYVHPIGQNFWNIDIASINRLIFTNLTDSQTFRNWTGKLVGMTYSSNHVNILSGISVFQTSAGYTFTPVYTRYRTDVSYDEMLKSIYGTERYTSITETQQKARLGYQKLQSMDNAYFAIGNNLKTITRVTMRRNRFGSVDVFDCLFSESGDGTVPFYSGNMLSVSERNSPKYTYYKLSHGGLTGHKDGKKDKWFDEEWEKDKNWILDVLNGEYDHENTSSMYNTENEQIDESFRKLRFEGDVSVKISSGDEYLSNSEEGYNDTSSFGCMEVLGESGDITIFFIEDGTEYTIECSAKTDGVIGYSEAIYSNGETVTSAEYPCLIVQAGSNIDIQENAEKPAITIDYENDGNVDTYIDNSNKEYLFTVKYSDGGSGDPFEDLFVKEGSGKNIDILADEGYCISKILINGERYSATAVNGLTEYTLSFENVSENYNVFVQFRKIGEPDLTDIGDVLLEDVPADGIIPEGIWVAGIKNQVYMGSAIKQSFRVYDGKTMLKEKADYTVTYKNTTNAYTFQGTDQDHLTANDKKKAPQIIIKSNSKGNYKGSRTVYFSIEPVNIETDEQVYIENEITLKETTKVQRPVPVITFNGKTVSSKEYTLTYLDSEGNMLDKKTGPKTAGTYMIRIEGNNKNFKGTKNISLTISETTTKEKAVSLSKAATVTAAAAEYDGTAKNTASITNKAGYELTEGKDYTVAYTKNVNAGTATVTATGKGIYTGTVRKTFKITPRLYADHTDEFRFEVNDAVYSKGGAVPEVHVFWNDSELKAGTDYTLKYANNKKVTDEFVSKWPTVTITFKGNYKGSVTKDFFIDPKPLSSVSITAKDKVYSAKANAWKSAPVLKDTDGKTLKAGTDYEKTITYTTANDAELPAVVEAGTVIKVTVTGKGNYTDTVSTTYRILDTGKDISKATFKITQKEYTGSPVTLTEADITATINKTTPLKLGTDFVIDGYTNNLKKGTAKVTLRGINGYGGTKTISFKIGQRSIVDYWQGVKDFFARMF